MVLGVALRRIGSMLWWNILLKARPSVGEYSPVLRNRPSQCLWRLQVVFSRWLILGSASVRDRFQSWQWQPLKWQGRCGRKAGRLPRSGDLGFALSPWPRALILGLSVLSGLKGATSQPLFFSGGVDTEEASCSSWSQTNPRPPPVLLIAFWDPCGGSLSWRWIRPQSIG